MRMAALVVILAVGTAGAQWQLQESHTTASLRGIHSVGGGVAWASGSEGTVLRTVDGGKNWVKCAVPEGGEKLDFRGVQGFDAKTAIVMSSGKGDLSRLYKTVDGCGTWMLIKTNEDNEGFWDALKMWTPTDGFLAGDPVKGTLYFAESEPYYHDVLDRGEDALWRARKGEAAFSASNSSLALGAFGTKDGEAREVWFATGGSSGSRVFHFKHFNGGEPERESLQVTEMKMFPVSESAGIFALAFRDSGHGVAVGGDYKFPDGGSHSAASADDSSNWSAAESGPHGYRSAVAYDAGSKVWITVGPNGTDVSSDDGRNWRALSPGPGDVADADRGWNALSLPFVVGSRGRIGVLRDGVLGRKKRVEP